MKAYTFLFKPVFFIFSLLFATWLVIKVEEISPSDFKGKTNSDPQKNIKENPLDKGKKLRNLIFDYKKGSIDSLSLDKEITDLLSHS
jgi:hypothetical protein